MKKSYWRVLISLTIVVVLLITMVSCTTSGTNTNDGATTNKGSENIKPTKIKFFRVAVEQDPKKDRTLIELQKRTNTDIEFITSPWDQMGTKIMTMLASREECDIMSIDPGGINYLQLANDGLIMQLDDLLKTDNYPIAKKLAYAEVFYRKYNIDGKVFGIPLPIQPGDWNHIIRKDWLENVGLDMPKTPEDMYEVLKRFKQDDPNKSGKDDTLGIYVAQPNGQLQSLLNMFMFSGISFDTIDGELVYNFTSPKYKKALQFIQKVYSEDLINKDFVTIKDKNFVLNQFSAGTSGVANSPMIVRTYQALTENTPGAEIELLSPLPHDEGTNGANATDSKWNWKVNVIPTSSKNPEKVLELLEYLHSEEGRKLICVGIEGIHYKSYKDGVFYGHNQEEQNKDWDPAKAEGPTGSPMWWGLSSTINGVIPFDKYDSVEEALKNVTTFVTEDDLKTNPYYDMRKLGSLLTYHDPVPAIIPEFDEVKGNLSSIRMEYEAILITAQANQFDQLWDEYVERMNAAGLPDALEAAKKWYEKNK